jgi:hypothetical protein
MNCEDKTAMKMTARIFASFVLVACFASISMIPLVRAQAPATTSAPAAAAQPSAPGFHFAMVPATIVTINYQHRMGSTDIGFAGTPIESFATGHAEVSGKVGRIQIDAEFSKLDPATNFGPEYLTYVLWAITPEGKATIWARFC